LVAIEKPVAQQPVDPPPPPTTLPPVREPQVVVTQTAAPIAPKHVVRLELELGANTTAPLGVSANGVARSEFANPPGIIGMRAAAYGLALVITTTADDIPGATFGWLTFCLAGSYRFPI